ncbi:hypothetical protein ONS96_007043 [Cadophora gregata f. sp. sojae]|nr:hypothetical protein ONS96_007043 [Cadophora gregata f. sp. sojae]
MVNFKATLLHGLVGLNFLSSVSASPIAQNSVIPNSEVIDENDGWQFVSASLIDERSALAKVDTDTTETGLEKRVFTTPNMRRAFKVVLANAVNAASWVIDFSMKEIRESGYDKVSLSYTCESFTPKQLSNVNVDIPTLWQITKTQTQFRGNAHVILSGEYNGQEIKIEFHGEVFGSAAEIIWQSMITTPVAYVASVPVAIKSWSFYQVYP